MSPSPSLHHPNLTGEISTLCVMYIKVGSGEMWSEAAIARFSEIVTGAPLKAVVVNSQPMSLTMQLYVR